MGGDRAASRSVRYAGAVAVTAVALGLRALFPEALKSVPYSPAYFGVLAGARYLGLGPSILIAVGGGIGCTLIPPGTGAVRLVLFLAVSAVIIWIVEGFRRASAAAHRNARLADDRLTQLEAEGRRPHWRFLLAEEDIVWGDLVRGPAHFHGANLSDPVLFRADRRPLPGRCPGRR